MIKDLFFSKDIMQKYIKWDAKYNTGHSVIDHQHRHFVYLINCLEESINKQISNPELLNIILNEVTNYTVYHFSTEEEIMEVNKYERMEEHKILHREFIQKLNILKVDAQKNSSGIDMIFCDFLRDWFIDHIANEDRKISV